MARPRGATGLTIRGQSFLASGVMLLLCGVVLGLGDLVRLGLLLVVGCVLALVGARRSPEHLAVVREFSPTTLTAGEPARVAVRVLNAATRRTPVLVATETLPLTLGDRPRMVLPSLRAAEDHILAYTITPRLRGELTLGPLTVRVRDALGLTTRELAVGGDHVVLVQPRVVPLDGQVPAPVGAGSTGSFTRGMAATGIEDVSVRAYRHGDELRRIHWKATAKRGDLMVRQEERPTRRVAVVLLDSRAASHSGRDEDSTFEWAVGATASVVAHLQAQGYTVTLVCDETADTVRYGTTDPPGDVLARARTGSADDFARCAHVVDEIATSGAVVVAVLGADPDDEALLAATRHPSTRGIALVVAPRADGSARAVARSTAASLAERGWRTTVADPTASVADAWARTTHGEAAS